MVFWFSTGCLKLAIVLLLFLWRYVYSLWLLLRFSVHRWFSAIWLWYAYAWFPIYLSCLGFANLLESLNCHLLCFANSQSFSSNIAFPPSLHSGIPKTQVQGHLPMFYMSWMLSSVLLPYFFCMCFIWDISYLLPLSYIILSFAVSSLLLNLSN